MIKPRLQMTWEKTYGNFFGLLSEFVAGVLSSILEPARRHNGGFVPDGTLSCNVATVSFMDNVM